MMTHPEGLTLLNSFDIEKELLPLHCMPVMCLVSQMQTQVSLTQME